MCSNSVHGLAMSVMLLHGFLNTRYMIKLLSAVKLKYSSNTSSTRHDETTHSLPVVDKFGEKKYWEPRFWFCNHCVTYMYTNNLQVVLADTCSLHCKFIILRDHEILHF